MLRLNVRKWFFMKRVYGPWSMLLREVVTASSLMGFRECSDDALRKMVGFWVVLCEARS